MHENKFIEFHIDINNILFHIIDNTFGIILLFTSKYCFCKHSNVHRFNKEQSHDNTKTFYVFDVFNIDVEFIAMLSNFKLLRHKSTERKISKQL